jgi:hypothetical protein
MHHQSSSSSRPFFCIALCLALNASANPPAKEGVGVLRPLFSPLPPLPFMLIPESRGAGGGAGLRPAAGLFAGGAGGVGLPRTAAPFAPFGLEAPGGGGGGVGRMTGAAGGGGGASSFRYAEGAQPWPVAVLASHHPKIFVRFVCRLERKHNLPLFSFWRIVIRSSFLMVISFALWPAKS